MSQLNDWHLGQFKLARRSQTSVPSNDTSLTVGEDRIGETKLSD